MGMESISGSFVVSTVEDGESWRIVFTYEGGTVVEIKDIPCEADYSRTGTKNINFYLQHIVNGKWTICSDYYYAMRFYNNDGTIKYGYNSASKAGGGGIYYGFLNNSNYHYFEVYFVTAAISPSGDVTSNVPAVTSNIFMNARINKIPAGDDGYTFDVMPSVMSWNASSSGVLTSFGSQSGVVRMFHGGGSAESISGTVSAASLPLGFVFSTSSNGGFSIQPSQKYCSYVNSGSYVYVMKAQNAIVVGDSVYNSSMQKVGTVTSVTSSTGYVTSLVCNGATYTYSSVTSTTLANPSNVELSLTNNGVTRTVSLQLLPNKSGTNGSTGKMGRFPYFAGVWEDAASTDTFVVSDTATPFFAYTSGTKTEYAVWKGANGTGTGSTRTKAQMSPIDTTGSNWAVMWENFEYIISKAIFSEMAKLGSAIFNGDYMFSQYGKDSTGAGSYHYENFDPSQTPNPFQPNIVMNWLTGEGRFVNVTVEGVINNLIQEINDDNMSNYGVYNTESQIFWLNASKVGSIIAYNVTHPLALPSAFADENHLDHTWLCDTDDGTHQMTLSELRQCIGKKIYVLTGDNSSMAKIYCGLDSINGMLKFQGSFYYEWPGSGSTSSHFFYVLECKMGDKNGRECIYWELEASYNKLSDTLAN